jgi:hypothetical protein
MVTGRSPGEAQRTPGTQAQAFVAPDCASLHPGYAVDNQKYLETFRNIHAWLTLF